jgi:hypothetical protein
MKKKLIIIFLLSLSFSTYGQRSYLQNLDSVATITFPNTPSIENTETGKFYSLKIGDVIYIAQSDIAEKNFKDLFTRHLSDSIYDGVIEGTVTALKGKILYRKKISLKGLEGVEYGYKAKIKDSDYYCYQQAFFFNHNFILYGYWSPDSLKTNDKGLRTFFGTFKLTINDDEIRQGNASDLGYKAGEFMVILLIIGVVVLLGFGVVYIIKKITYK